MSEHILVNHSVTVIVPCTSRKAFKVPVESTAVSLPMLPQRGAETAWLKKLSSLSRTVRAVDLYSGRGMSLGREAAKLAGARLLIASAGLGIIDAEQMIAPYALTVATRGDDAITSRVEGRFDPGEWWLAVANGPMARSFSKVFEGARSGRLLVALSHPYARMLADALATIPLDARINLRLFGWRLDEVLPASLHPAIMPYDARLDTVLPGTRSDYPQRALLHFVRETCSTGLRGSSASDSSLVRDRLGRFEAPKRIARPRASDDQILDWLGTALEQDRSIARLLKLIRSSGVACEQARFSRLYRVAFKQGAAA